MYVTCTIRVCVCVYISPMITGIYMYQFSHSVGSNSVTPWTAARQASLSITNVWSLLKLVSIKPVMPSNHLILCRPLLLLPSVFPSISLFIESALPIRWPKYWSFSFSISPSNEYPGLISFRMGWLDLLAVQGTLESSPTPQFESINSPVLSSATYCYSNLNELKWKIKSSFHWLYISSVS